MLVQSGLDGPSGVARHISSAGCQFVLEVGELESGQRLAFALEGVGTILGMVRWTLNNRVGFAFENALDADAQRVLAFHGRASRRFDLQPVTG